MNQLINLADINRDGTIDLQDLADAYHIGSTVAPYAQAGYKRARDWWYEPSAAKRQVKLFL